MVYRRRGEKQSPSSTLLDECYFVRTIQGRDDKAALSSGRERHQQHVISFKIATPVQHNHIDRMLCAAKTLDEWHNLLWLTDGGQEMQIIKICQKRI